MTGISGMIMEDGTNWKNSVFGCQLTNLKQSQMGIGFISGGAITASVSPDMQTHVAASVVRMSATESVGAKDLTHDAAHATLHRYDLIYFAEELSDWTIIKGTPAASPVCPSFPTDKTNCILAAIVYIAATDTDLTSAEIKDCRCFTLASQTTTEVDLDTGYESNTYTNATFTSNGLGAYPVFIVEFTAGDIVDATYPQYIDFKYEIDDTSNYSVVFLTMNGHRLSGKISVTGGAQVVTSDDTDIGALVRPGKNSIIFWAGTKPSNTSAIKLYYIRHVKFRHYATVTPAFSQVTPTY